MIATCAVNGVRPRVAQVVEVDPQSDPLCEKLYRRYTPAFG